MATEVGKLYYDLSIDDSRLKRGLDSADNSVENTGSKFAGLGKAVAAGVAVAGAATVAFGISSVKAFDESQAAIAQTEAVLKSTAGVAGVTAEMVENLASSLQNNSKFSDEQVRSAQNMLLTFTKIGKDVFPEATLAVADMAQAMGQDLTQTSIQVGKALQDPVQGVTALQRVGVRLTEDQKKLVEQMVSTGDVAGAQRLILKELATEFGGSAEAAGNTFGGQLIKAKNKLNDLQEAIGEAIVKRLQPLIQKFNEWFDKAGGVEGVMQKIKDGLEKISPYIDVVKGAFGILLGIVKTLFNALTDLWGVLDRNKILLAMIGGVLAAFLIPILVLTIAQFVLLIAQLILTGAAWLIAFWPIIAIGAAIGAIAFLIITNWETLKQWFTNAIEWFKTNWPLLLAILFGPFGLAVLAIVKNWDTLKKWFTDAWSWFKDIGKKIGEGIANGISGAVDGVKNTVKAALNWIIDKANTAIRGINKVSPPGVPEVGEIPKLSKGIENFGGGLAYVHGGEVLTGLAPGSSVIKKSDVQNMMNAVGGGGGGTNITINVSGMVATSKQGLRDISQEIFNAFNEGLRAQGKMEVGV